MMGWELCFYCAYSTLQSALAMQFFCIDVIIPCTLAMGVYLHLYRESI